MRERVRQLSFGDSNKEWAKPKDLDMARKYAYGKVVELFRNYTTQIPRILEFDAERSQEYATDDSVVKISPRTLTKKWPAIADINIPERFRDYIYSVAAISERRERTSLPVDLWSTFEGTQESPSAAGDFAQFADDYSDWIQMIREEINAPKAVGTTVRVENQNGTEYSFGLSKTGQVVQFKSFATQPASVPLNQDEKRSLYLPQLFTHASFRGGKLFTLYAEVPNGTLFDDPRGDINAIWPRWVMKRSNRFGWSTSSVDLDHRIVTEEDWQKYLADAGAGNVVFSPRSHEYVRQTRKQAEKNLERYRLLIYYKTPQAFRFYHTDTHPEFKSQIGYGIRSSFDPSFKFISRNETSYSEPGYQQTVALLTSWDPLSGNLLHPQENCFE